MESAHLRAYKRFERLWTALQKAALQLEHSYTDEPFYEQKVDASLHRVRLTI
jgi:ferric-dicitrate binding protein FerR (iron transport regulator)